MKYKLNIMYNDWKTKFFEVYFDDDSTTKEIDKFLEIKNNNIPKYLYKYTKIKHADDLLENGLFYLSEIEDLNDPYEGNILYDLDLQVKRFIEYWIERNERLNKKDYENFNISKEVDEIKELIKEGKLPLTTIERETDVKLLLSNMKSGKEIYNIINDMQTNRVKKFFESLNELLRKDTKVVCLTESRNNNPLWYHYGNKHQGICIKYNTEKFSTLLKNNSFPIFYDNSHFSDNMPIKDIEKLKEKYNLKAFLKKSEDWRCEKEWRIIITDNMREKYPEYYENNQGQYLRLKPEAVYLGKEFPTTEKDRFVKMCKDNNIKIFEMKLTNIQYNLIESKL